MNTLIRLLTRSLGGMLLALGATQSCLAAGLMTPADGSLPALQIKQHHVNVVIENGYAITSVEQVFFNPNHQELEAIYSFPVPEKAAVGEFTYWIDGQPISGEVMEKKQARAVYEHEKAQGRETALVEQDAHRSFENSVYPVRAQQDVKIKLVYIQPAHVDSSIGRYVYPLEEGGVDQEKLAFWSYNSAVTEAFSFNVTLRSAYPIDGLRLPHHPQAAPVSTDAHHWQVSLINSTAAANSTGEIALENSASEDRANISPHVVHTLDKDIVLYWRHQQGLPGSVDMITHKEPGSDRGTFMMTITPGSDLAPINEGRDWVFVLDLSGSMQGKYQSMIEGVNRGLQKLKPEDRFRVILFNDSAREITQGYMPATPDQVKHYIQQLEQTPPEGGTNLYSGLKTGINGLDSDRASALILVTDGEANVGVTEKKAFLQLLEQHDVRLFTFVMGNSANRPLLDGMTKISNGFAISVSNSDDIIGQLMLATDKLTHEAFHDIDVSIKGIKVKDMTPARIGSLYHGQQLIVFGHYWGHGMADVSIKGKISGQPKTYQTRFEFPQTNTTDPEVERLWAYASIEDLQQKMDYFGEDTDSREAITGLAIEYGLVTDYTSMIVVREEVFQQLNINRTNATRVANEQQARANRSAAPIQNNRQDTHQPAFSSPRATPSGGGGGGSINALLLALILSLAFVQLKKHRRL